MRQKRTCFLDRLPPSSDAICGRGSMVCRGPCPECRSAQRPAQTHQRRRTPSHVSEFGQVVCLRWKSPVGPSSYGTGCRRWILRRTAHLGPAYRRNGSPTVRMGFVMFTFPIPEVSAVAARTWL